ncbi:MAG: hypothetical protein AB7V27_07045 [Candidatus Binatia bacterium]
MSESISSRSESRIPAAGHMHGRAGVNGSAHIQLTADDPGRCLLFWEKLCHSLDMQTLIKGDQIVYRVGSRTRILGRAAPREKAVSPFGQVRPASTTSAFAPAAART